MLLAGPANCSSSAHLWLPLINIIITRRLVRTAVSFSRTDPNACGRALSQVGRGRLSCARVSVERMMNETMRQLWWLPTPVRVRVSERARGCASRAGMGRAVATRPDPPEALRMQARAAKAREQ